MTDKLATLKAALEKALGNRVQSLTESVGELTLVVKAADYLDAMRTLRDDASLKFEQLMDLCGVDYADYGDGAWNGPRFAAVSHLLSITHNWRVRVRVFAPDDDLPVVSSVTTIWNSADWFEREAFDLYGLVFEGHPDLRRILTDYGFIGHPFRKDFPVSGYVEMRYDPVQRRVVYQPVTIEPREITPRVIREDQYGGLKH
ncbi:MULTISPECIES: NADH-quinone oxidoreductase subunit C [Ralstonia]|jgi:NADH-quinone oxidoreductase subunit C|uniref:NADH-quinone oxidoreductase subunit C n=3 Tax=Ralstonia TaxID=48736 RepID=NUOC_RALPJ|nr:MULTISPECIES: NADH-quinone oxidoreductase subunit C [Ralstonia]B2U7Q9.1 RecName: Full=NADH-quinone oxidoreductase subunit C; AltName: Full=NADH dehydrogenase I subunit C; AltName: Full=NDH-1 subunit C [Ralstonia pickettii 12J]MEA3270561.1 NADH-quinone oxidoreductase subunit C [Pseudomonadota bacterium]ENZ77408.1 NADH dehydrogenase subunit C [Ralstonia pickettii OR214]MBB0023016.1 NADH-quinone oxidoreductase subunit C [Ralstonia pickettii]MBB0033573.1 NADH-quinone oxidoreductase subunit C [R